MEPYTADHDQHAAASDTGAYRKGRILVYGAKEDPLQLDAAQSEIYTGPYKYLPPAVMPITHEADRALWQYGGTDAAARGPTDRGPTALQLLKARPPFKPITADEPPRRRRAARGAVVPIDNTLHVHFI